MYNLIIFIFYFFIFITVYQLYKNVVTLIFPLVIFLWTTWGGIIFQLNLSGIFFGPEHYQYLFQKLAVVRYGSDFILANLIYGVGIVTCLSTYFFTLRNQKRNLIKLNYNNLNFPTSQVLTLIIICFILFIFLVYPKIQQFISSKSTLYYIVRFGDVSYFTLISILIRMMLTCAVIYLGIKKKKIITSVVFLIIFCVILVYSIVSGGKNELLYFCLLYIFYNTHTGNIAISKKKLMVMLLGVIVVGAFVDTVRGFNSDELSLLNASSSLFHSFNILFSNEFFGLYFGMYYAVLFEVRSYEGWFFLPMSLLQMTPENWGINSTYSSYTKFINAEKGQGYGLHHFVGLFILGGFLPLIFGSAVFGMIAGIAQKRIVRLKRRPINQANVDWLSLIACTTLANLPMIFRNGIEGYKGLIIDGVLVPVFIGVFCLIGYKFKTSCVYVFFPKKINVSPNELQSGNVSVPQDQTNI